jgi:hypothetical protein
MSIPHFFGVVRYSNQLLLPRGLYPPIDAPEDVPVWAPFMVSMAEMVTEAIDRRNRYGYATRASLDSFPSGYTRSDLTLRFVNFSRQWRSEASRWHYQGGQICLELTLGVFADERAEDRPQCLSMILTHELKHVADEIDIVTNWLPRRAPIELRSRFAPLGQNAFERAMRGRGDGRGSNLERAVQGMWIEESSRRAQALHSQRPEDGARIRDCINA